MVTGLSTTIMGTVLVGRAAVKAYKANEMLAEQLKTIDEVHENISRDKYTDQDKVDDIKACKYDRNDKIALAFAVPVLVEGAGLGCMVASNLILKKRGAAVAAALSSLTAAYAEYRLRVKETVGEEKEANLFTGSVNKKLPVTETDEKGKEKVVNRNVSVIEEKPKNPYMFIFSKDSSLCYETADIYNEMLLKSTQNYYNDKLKISGHVFLNEVLDSLGMDRVPWGQITGWTEKGEDQYIDFRAKKETTIVDGKNTTCWVLDFNVDGPIYQYIDTYNKRWGE